MNNPQPSHQNDVDQRTLTELNKLYIQCVVHADAQKFESILAEDFLCSNPDGSIVDRTEFLRRVAGSSRLQFMDIADVKIRLVESVAIIHAQTTFATAEGIPGKGRYTDIWAKRDGKWLAVAAHVTRL